MGRAAPGDDAADLGTAAQRDRRRRILDSTVELARDGGFEAVQMRAVAEHAGVALGTLYRYFPSKIHLLVSTLAREFHRIEQDTRDQAIPGDTAPDRVRVVLGGVFRGLQQDPQLAEALTRAFMFADSSVSEAIDEVTVLLGQMITRAIRGDRSDAAPSEQEALTASIIGDVWHSALMSWVTGRLTTTQVLERVDRAVALVLR